jgi:hypothetical protein
MTDESTPYETVLAVFIQYGEAYYRGRVAADLNHAYTDCPYDPEDRQAKVWKAGWIRQSEIWLQLKAALKPL